MVQRRRRPPSIPLAGPVCLRRGASATSTMGATAVCPARMVTMAPATPTGMACPGMLMTKSHNRHKRCTALAVDCYNHVIPTPGSWTGAS
nr:MAG TPA: hypothetical protein [Caudoviricetes sp.]